jgi:flagellar basal body-associated protein FliL
MLKLVAIGIWVILVTAGATFGSVYFAHSSAEEDSTEEPNLGVEELKSEMTSVPVMRNGDVIGYLILQLSFAADRRLLEDRKVDPLPFMMDAAFRVIFAATDVDFRRLRSKDLEELTTAIAKEANTRIGADLVRHVLLQQWNFVKKEDIRTNWIGNGSGDE